MKQVYSDELEQQLLPIYVITQGKTLDITISKPLDVDLHYQVTKCRKTVLEFLYMRKQLAIPAGQVYKRIAFKDRDKNPDEIGFNTIQFFIGDRKVGEWVFLVVVAARDSTEVAMNKLLRESTCKSHQFLPEIRSFLSDSSSPSNDINKRKNDLSSDRTNKKSKLDICTNSIPRNINAFL
jgi:hypothetical protein